MHSQRLSIDRRSFVSQTPVHVQQPNPTITRQGENLPQQPHVAIDMEQQNAQRQAATATVAAEQQHENQEIKNNLENEVEKPLVESFRHKWKRRIKRTCKSIGYGCFHRKNGRKIFCGLSCSEWLLNCTYLLLLYSFVAGFFLGLLYIASIAQEWILF